MLPDGRIAFSTLGPPRSTVSGLTMLNGDIALYDPSNGIASLIFSEDAFGADQDVDAVR